MNFGEILVLSLGLAMDATAVAAAKGLAAPKIQARHVLLVAGLFGGFQALMPLVGWFLGNRIGPLIQEWDHWVAFVLLEAIGGKMLWESVHHQPETLEATDVDPFSLRVMLILAIATSIDALAVGITLPMLNAPFVVSLATIGVTTALLSTIGLLAGRRLGPALGKRLDVVGGLVLMGFGIKILIEHLSAA